MLRAKWEFEYTAAKLAEAAKLQLGFRVSKVRYWTNKKEEIIAEIKSKGMTVYEGVDTADSSYKYSASTSMGGAQILIDPTLQGDLNQCQAKITMHTGLRDQYNAWVQVLEGNPESRVKLDHDDWMFFFGK